jgi:hypothetical protein
VKTSEIIKICIAIATIAIGLTAYSLLVALQSAAI